jgi:hypothetical protein
MRKVLLIDEASRMERNVTESIHSEFRAVELVQLRDGGADMIRSYIATRSDDIEAIVVPLNLLTKYLIIGVEYRLPIVVFSRETGIQIVSLRAI